MADARTDSTCHVLIDHCLERCRERAVGEDSFVLCSRYASSALFVGIQLLPYPSGEWTPRTWLFRQTNQPIWPADLIRPSNAEVAELADAPA